MVRTQTVVAEQTALAVPCSPVGALQRPCQPLSPAAPGPDQPTVSAAVAGWVTKDGRRVYDERQLRDAADGDSPAPASTIARMATVEFHSSGTTGWALRSERALAEALPSTVDIKLT